MLIVDVDGDFFADVIAEGLPDVYWLEAEDKSGNSWKAKKIGTLPKTGYVNGQSCILGQIIPGGKPEFILACGDGIYYFQIPENADKGNWPNSFFDIHRLTSYLLCLAQFALHVKLLLKVLQIISF